MVNPSPGGNNYQLLARQRPGTSITDSPDISTISPHFPINP
jgi:hypothetical protein